MAEMLDLLSFEAADLACLIDIHDGIRDYRVAHSTRLSHIIDEVCLVKNQLACNHYQFCSWVIFLYPSAKAQQRVVAYFSCPDRSSIRKRL